jgi:hypothetical protein
LRAAAALAGEGKPGSVKSPRAAASEGSEAMDWDDTPPERFRSRERAVLAADLSRLSDAATNLEKLWRGRRRAAA